MSSQLRHSVLHNNIQQIEETGYDAYTLKISSLGQKKSKTMQFDAQVVALRTQGKWNTYLGKVLVSVPDSIGSNLSPETVLVVKDYPLKRPIGALNPEEFDYKKYLERQGIAWTVYLPENSYQVVATPTGNNPLYWPLVLSQKADSVFRQYLTKDTSYGLVKAMLLGRRGDLGSDLLNAYITAGAVHVLAVSGLHVGILFVFLSRLTGFLRRSKKGKYAYLALVLSFLSFYALLTGLSPSVVRASLMCLTFAASQTFNRQHHNLNTLAFSAFLILLFDPQALFAVGFQLSYAAVLGILLLYPLLKDVLPIRNTYLRWVWQITLVGCTAQLFTFPISIYYFHQFPTYFWLVNPVVIVLTSVLIYSALGLLVMSYLPVKFFAVLVGQGLDLIATFMNQVVAFPRKLPHFVVENLSLDLLEVSILAVWILSIYWLLNSREFVALKRVFLITLLFVQYSFFKIITDYRNPALYFHAVPRHTVLSLNQGQKGYVLADEGFFADSSSYKAHLDNFMKNRGIQKVQFISLADSRSQASCRINWQGKNIGIDTQKGTGEESWIVLRNRFYPRSDVNFPKKQALYIVSPELGFKTRERWIELLTESQIRFHNPGEKGALQF